MGLMLLLAAGRPAFAAATSGATMTVADVVALLKAGVGEQVILGQVHATGTALALDVPDILLLKAAGAGDNLLAALIAGTTGGIPAGTPGGTPCPGSGQSQLRVYRVRGENGEEVLHVTNLDESGRRIGGELPAAERPAPPEPSFSRERDPGGPVIVNVYPQPQSELVPQSTGGYVAGGGRYLGGLYPGYLGGPGAGFCRTCPRVPSDRRAGMQNIDGGLFSRPSAINTLPYRTHTAAERNQQRFGQN